MGTQNTKLAVNEFGQEDQSKHAATQQAVTAIDELTDLQINDRQAAEVNGGPLLFRVRLF